MENREEELIQAYNRFFKKAGDVVTLPAYKELEQPAIKLINMLKAAGLDSYYKTAVMVLDAAHDRATR